MIRPCKCDKYVHYSCLEKWRESRSGNKDRCEICHTKYSGATISDGKKSISEYFIYTVLILLSFFVMIGCTGYDIVGETFKDNNNNTPFEDFIMVSTLLGIFIEIDVVVISVFFTFMGENDFAITKKNIVRFLFVNIGLQIIPVLVCSIIFKRFFWNISTLGMALMAVLGVAVTCSAIGLIVIGIFTIKSDQNV